MPLKKKLSENIEILIEERKRLLASENSLKKDLEQANNTIKKQKTSLNKKDEIIKSLQDQVNLLTPEKKEIGTQTELSFEDINLLESKIKTLSQKLIIASIYKNASDYMRKDLVEKVKNLDLLVFELARERKWLTERGNEFQEKIEELEKTLDQEAGDTYNARVKVKELEVLLAEKDEYLTKLPEITKKEFEEIEKRLTKFKQKAHNRKLEIKGLETEILENERKERDYQNKFSDLNLTRSELELKLTEAKYELQVLAKDGIKPETIDNQKKKIELINEDLQNVKSQLRLLEEERYTFEKEIEVKKKELTETIEKLKEKEEQLTSFKTIGIGVLEGKINFVEKKELDGVEKNILWRIKNIIEICQEIKNEEKLKEFEQAFSSLMKVWKEEETINFKEALSKNEVDVFFNEGKNLIYNLFNLKNRLEKNSNIERLEREIKSFQERYEDNRKIMEIAEKEKGILKAQNDFFLKQKKDLLNKLEDLERLSDNQAKNILNLQKKEEELKKDLAKREAEIKTKISELETEKEENKEKFNQQRINLEKQLEEAKKLELTEEERKILGEVQNVINNLGNLKVSDFEKPLKNLKKVMEKEEYVKIADKKLGDLPKNTWKMGEDVKVSIKGWEERKELEVSELKSKLNKEKIAAVENERKSFEGERRKLNELISSLQSQLYNKKSDESNLQSKYNSISSDLDYYKSKVNNAGEWLLAQFIYVSTNGNYHVITWDYDKNYTNTKNLIEDKVEYVLVQIWIDKFKVIEKSHNNNIIEGKVNVIKYITAESHRRILY